MAKLTDDKLTKVRKPLAMFRDCPLDNHWRIPLMLPSLIGLSFGCMQAHSAIGQAAQFPQSAPNAAIAKPHGRPVSLEHLYLYFLIHIKQLDTMAAQEDAQGGNGSSLRNHLQTSLGFTDAEFAPIRESAGRLTSELADLDVQATTVRSGGGDQAAVNAQLKQLTSQREADVRAEVVLIGTALPADRVTALEAFMTQFFAPKHISVRVTGSSQQTVPTSTTQQ